MRYSIELSEEEISAIKDGLSQLKYRKAAPVLEEIASQMRRYEKIEYERDRNGMGSK